MSKLYQGCKWYKASWPKLRGDNATLLVANACKSVIREALQKVFCTFIWFCTQGVWLNGRKNFLFEIWKFLLWVGLPCHIASRDGTGWHRNICLVAKHKSGILILFADSIFACLPNLFENSFASLVNTIVFTFMCSWDLGKKIRVFGLEKNCYWGSKWACW